MLGAVVFLEGQFLKHHQMWLEPAVREWSLLLKFNIMSICKTTFLNKKKNMVGNHSEV